MFFVVILGHVTTLHHTRQQPLKRSPDYSVAELGSGNTKPLQLALA